MPTSFNGRSLPKLESVEIFLGRVWAVGSVAFPDIMGVLGLAKWLRGRIVNLGMLRIYSPQTEVKGILHPGNSSSTYPPLLHNDLISLINQVEAFISGCIYGNHLPALGHRLSAGEASPLWPALTQYSSVSAARQAPASAQRPQSRDYY